MRIELDEINSALQANPRGYVAQCDALYQNRVGKAADLVVSRLERSRVVLLAGPSSSGKTTTASRVRKALEERGIYAHIISLDDYYRAKSGPGTENLTWKPRRGWILRCLAAIWKLWTEAKRSWSPISTSRSRPGCRRSADPFSCRNTRWSSSREFTD